MLASRSYHSPYGCTLGTNTLWKMHPREKISTDLRLEFVAVLALVDDDDEGDGDGSAPVRNARTSGACQPMLPGAAPPVKELS